MSCKTPILRAVYDSPTAQTVASDGLIQFTSETSNSCCRDWLNQGTITLKQNGTYEIHFNATAVATAAGTIEVQMYRNGNVVPGAHAYGTAAAIGDFVPMAFTGLCTVDCCCGDTISFRAINATSFNVANVTLEAVN